MTYESRFLAGVLLIVLPTVMIGGVSILSLLIGDPAYMENPLRQALWRAGHAHAGVWLILALVSLRYVDEADLSNVMKWLVRGSIPIAAILVPAAFISGKAQNEQMLPVCPGSRRSRAVLPLPTRANCRLLRRSKDVPGGCEPTGDRIPRRHSQPRERLGAHSYARHPRSTPRFAFRLKVPGRTYERPARRKAFAAFAADTKVA